ncbi:hypothetical protein [Akkermansia muciniphila]|uniref:hypothetical protein n=1 Tax=Akkermansia muciniphila TaxID=239935 RepID=UPI0011AEEBA8|nr:hypothetical protein [Akkermansia muciniphila]
MNVMHIKIDLNPSKDSLKKFNSPVMEKPSAAENLRLPLNEFPFTAQGSGDFQLSSRGSAAPIFQHHGMQAERREREKGIFTRRDAGAFHCGKA